MKPIIFNTEMVRAILDGRKTQTRRIIKPQPKEGSSGFKLCRPLDDCFGKKYIKQFGVMYKPPKKEWLDDTHPMWNFVKCPYGQPCDRLWVRETWLQLKKDIHYPEDMVIVPKGIYYRADNKLANPKWKPSIHMPKKYARIWLEITNIRVERVRDISEEDCLKEGLLDLEMARDSRQCKNQPVWSRNAKFGILWNSINEKRGYGWDKNPFVWVIEFKEAN